MESARGDALDWVVALARAPGERYALRQRPFPAGMEVVLQVAGGTHAVAIANAATHAGMTPADVVEAARFYLREMLFFPDADAYRVLGLAADASDEQVKHHHRLLQQWLHPDRPTSDWDASFAARVNAAWSQLRTPARREAYAASAAITAPAVASDPGWRPPTRAHVPLTEVNIGDGLADGGRWQRRAPVLALFALCAVLGVLAIRDTQREPGSHVGDTEVAAMDSEAAPPVALRLPEPAPKVAAAKPVAAKASAPKPAAAIRVAQAPLPAKPQPAAKAVGKPAATIAAKPPVRPPVVAVARAPSPKPVTPPIAKPVARPAAPRTPPLVVAAVPRPVSMPKRVALPKSIEPLEPAASSKRPVPVALIPAPARKPPPVAAAAAPKVIGKTPATAAVKPTAKPAIAAPAAAASTTVAATPKPAVKPAVKPAPPVVVAKPPPTAPATAAATAPAVASTPVPLPLPTPAASAAKPPLASSPQHVAQAQQTGARLLTYVSGRGSGTPPIWAAQSAQTQASRAREALQGGGRVAVGTPDWRVGGTQATMNARLNSNDGVARRLRAELVWRDQRWLVTGLSLEQDQ